MKSPNNKDRGRTNTKIVRAWQDLLGPELVEQLIREAHQREKE